MSTILSFLKRLQRYLADKFFVIWCQFKYLKENSIYSVQNFQITGNLFEFPSKTEEKKKNIVSALIKKKKKEKVKEEEEEEVYVERGNSEKNTERKETHEQTEERDENETDRNANYT
uniref:Uncharacterized protein n=1 Tax=Cacopsylla melanoneura TaxID=428564 RepID=A0A8D8UFV8_9HEMI